MMEKHVKERTTHRIMWNGEKTIFRDNVIGFFHLSLARSLSKYRVYLDYMYKQSASIEQSVERPLRLSK